MLEVLGLVSGWKGAGPLVHISFRPSQAAGMYICFEKRPTSQMSKLKSSGTMVLAVTSLPKWSGTSRASDLRYRVWGLCRSFGPLG